MPQGIRLQNELFSYRLLITINIARQVIAVNFKISPPPANENLLVPEVVSIRPGPTIPRWHRLSLSCRRGARCGSKKGPYSNLNKSTSSAQKSFDLLAYEGQTIRVYFYGVEDSVYQTSFLIDDTALNVTQ